MSKQSDGDDKYRRMIEAKEARRLRDAARTPAERFWQRVRDLLFLLFVVVPIGVAVWYVWIVVFGQHCAVPDGC